MGAAICCSDSGGLSKDDWTTCDRDRDVLLDRIFNLAKERGLLLDFHVDENGNERSRGLRDIAQKTIEHGYQGKVVCGHCWCVSIATGPAHASIPCVACAEVHSQTRSSGRLTRLPPTPLCVHAAPWHGSPQQTSRRPWHWLPGLRSSWCRCRW